MTKADFEQGQKGLIFKAITPQAVKALLKKVDHVLDEVGDWAPSDQASHEYNEKIMVLPSKAGFSGTSEEFRKFINSCITKAKGTRTQAPVLEVIVSPSPYNSRPFTPIERAYINYRIMNALGLEGQPHQSVVHWKHRRIELNEGPTEHWHLFVDRMKDGKAINLWNCGYKLNDLRIALCEEFGIYIEPPANPSSESVSAGRANRRGNLDRYRLQEDIRAMWESSKSGGEFRTQLEQAGYILRRGSKAALVVTPPGTNKCWSLKNLLGRKINEQEMLTKFSAHDLSLISLAPQGKSANRGLSKISQRKKLKTRLRTVNRLQAIVAKPIATPISRAIEEKNNVLNASPSTRRVQNFIVSQEYARQLLTATSKKYSTYRPADLNAIWEKYKPRILNATDSDSLKQAELELDHAIQEAIKLDQVSDQIETKSFEEDAANVKEVQRGYKKRLDPDV